MESTRCEDGHKTCHDDCLCSAGVVNERGVLGSRGERLCYCQEFGLARVGSHGWRHGSQVKLRSTARSYKR